MVFNKATIYKPENMKLKRFKSVFFIVVKFFTYLSLCVACAGVFGPLQHYIAALHVSNIAALHVSNIAALHVSNIAALHVSNIAAMLCLSNSSKCFCGYSNLLLNTTFTYFSVEFSFFMLVFACTLFYLCVCAFFMLYAA